MIHRLRHMIGSAQVSQSHPTMGYVRAVPLPFYGGLIDRLRDAREVLTGRAFAVRWPMGGELEAALADGVSSDVAELYREIDRLRSIAQSRYELLRECQSELRAHFDGGMVETIEAALARK